MRTFVETIDMYGLHAKRLRSSAVDAIVLPGKGADLTSFRCRATGAELLAQSPAAAHVVDRYLRDGADGYGDCFVGGWPSLLPSRARWATGSIGPTDCGEAATVAWTSREMLVRGRVRLVCSAMLPHSGLWVSRIFGFDDAGRRLTIVASVVNRSSQAIEFNWTEHPTFGGDLLDGTFEVLLPACEVIARSAAESRADVPCDTQELPDANAAALRSLRVPPGGSDVFVTLRQLARPWAAIFNARLGVGVQLAWDTKRLPHAWYWQSFASGQRSLAIEPANSYLTELPAIDSACTSLRLAPGESMTTRFSIRTIGPKTAARLRAQICGDAVARPSPAEVHRHDPDRPFPRVGRQSRHVERTKKRKERSR